MNFMNDRVAATLDELRQRLIHVEAKIDAIRPQDFAGHPDQRYGHLTYSQNGEDLVFAALFERLGIDRASYLDIGANHPVNCSNTALLYRGGSRGVNVDANPNVMDAFRRERPHDTNVNVGVSDSEGSMTFYRIDDFSGRNTFSKEAAENFIARSPGFKISDTLTVDVVTLDQLINTFCNGRCPDLLSIDAEGLDYEILRSYSFATRPAILCVETYSAAGEHEDDICELLKTKGFVRIIQMGVNGVFVDEQSCERANRTST
jgi:FkbM family methyltransferase